MYIRSKLLFFISSFKYFYLFLLFLREKLCIYTRSTQWNWKWKKEESLTCSSGARREGRKKKTIENNFQGYDGPFLMFKILIILKSFFLLSRLHLHYTLSHTSEDSGHMFIYFATVAQAHHTHFYVHNSSGIKRHWKLKGREVFRRRGWGTNKHTYSWIKQNSTLGT